MNRIPRNLSEIEQYILLFLSDGEVKRFSEIRNYLKEKGFRISGQYLVSRLNRLIALKFILPRPHPTRPNRKTYQITPLYARLSDEHAVVIHSPAFRRPVVIIPYEEYRSRRNTKEIVKKGYSKIIEKINNGDIDHETIVELLLSYREKA